LGRKGGRGAVGRDSQSANLWVLEFMPYAAVKCRRGGRGGYVARVLAKGKGEGGKRDNSGCIKGGKSSGKSSHLSVGELREGTRRDVRKGKNVGKRGKPVGGLVGVQKGGRLKNFVP